MKGRRVGIDTIKVLYTYTIATILIVGGILFLYFSRNDPPGGQAAMLVPVVTGFIGAAVQFVFNRETQAATSAQVKSAAATAVANTLTAQGQPNVLTPPPPDQPQATAPGN
jgi:hypothetical protein